MQSHRENDAHIRPTRPLGKAVGYDNTGTAPNGGFRGGSVREFPRECARFLAVLAQFQRVCEA